MFSSSKAASERFFSAPVIQVEYLDAFSVKIVNRLANPLLLYVIKQQHVAFCLAFWYDRVDLIRGSS